MSGTQLFGGSVPSYFGLVIIPHYVKVMHDKN